MPVLEVPGVLAIVGGAGCDPAPLDDSDIDIFRVGMKAHRVEPHPRLTTGQQVRIRSGAFTGLQGIVLRSKNGCRVVLTLKLTMQSFAVELHSEELEPLAHDVTRRIEGAGIAVSSLSSPGGN